MNLKLGYSILTMIVLAGAQAGQNSRSAQGLVSRQVPSPLTPEQCQCSIEVVLTSHNSGEPIAEAELHLTLTSEARSANNPRPTIVPVATGMTNSSGRFLFRDLAEGIYNISAHHDGYFDWGSGVIFIGHLGAANIAGVRVTDADIKQNPQISITLTPGGTIAGTVRDVNGRPMAKVTVQAFRLAFEGGVRKLQYVGGFDETDDQGKYRLRWFAAGEYFVRVERDSNPLHAIYHPDTAEPVQAIPVILREGEEKYGIDVAMPKLPAMSISGTVIVPFSGGDIAHDGTVTPRISSFYLVRRTSIFLDNPREIPNVEQTSGLDPNGREFPFRIQDVPSGEYDFYPVFLDLTQGPVDHIAGHAVIQVESHDIRDLRVEVHRNVDVAGHVTVPKSIGNFIQQVVGVRITGLQPLPMPLAGGTVSRISDASGDFLMENLSPGRYAIGVVLTREDLYVSDIRQGSRSVYDDAAITVGSETADPVEIIVSTGTATVSGTVQMDKTTSAKIVLVPEPPRRQNFNLYKSMDTFQPRTATFGFKGVAPGTYKLFAFAFEGLEFESLKDAEKIPEFMSQFESRGVRITVNAGATLTNIRIPLISNVH